jgi:apolipoprotein N-acyltransferase
MTTANPTPTSAPPERSVPPGDATSKGTPLAAVPIWVLLASGILLVFLSGNRAGIALLAWIAPVPLALAATRLRGLRGRALLLLACVAGVALQTLKLVSPPASPAFALLFGVPIGALGFAVLAAWDALQRRAGPAWSVHAFAALSALADLVGFALTPGGHWASAAANHWDDLPLMQVAALGGLGLVGLVAGYPAGAIASLLLAPAGRRPWRAAAFAAAAVATAHAWGTLRLDRQDLGPTVLVAAVTVDFPSPLRSMEDLRGNVETLFARTELAADRGARLVAWNEVATLLDPGELPALERRASDVARRRGIDLVAAFGVVLSREPFRFDNVVRWYGPDGGEVDRYRKHFLPPGEPSVAGEEPLRVVSRPWGRAGAAICYDYASPALAREHARGGAGIVAVPSSDWRGIDPQHTFLARVRAIEGGFSLLRPTRAGTSAAFDPLGRVRATMSAWEENERVMLAAVPSRPLRTPYAAMGDLPALAIAVAIAGGALAAAVRRRGPLTT